MDPLAWTFAPALDGELHLPGDPAFDAALPGYNLAVRRAPAAVVLDALGPWGTGGALLNLAGPRDAASSAALRAGWGPATYAALVALCRSSDPDGVLAASARWDLDD